MTRRDRNDFLIMLACFAAYGLIWLAMSAVLSGCSGSIESTEDCPPPSAIDPEKQLGTVTYPAVLPDCVCDRWTRGEIKPALTSKWAGGCYYAWQATETCGECSRVVDFVYEKGCDQCQ